jgi:ATP-dependent Clp protease adaptor protein ClpS
VCGESITAPAYRRAVRTAPAASSVVAACDRGTGDGHRPPHRSFGQWTWWPISGKVSSVPDVGYIAIVVAGFGAYWWRHMRPPRPRPALLAPDADVAVHVAMHEASSRRQELSSLHVLYGLLQDDAVIAAIRTAGGDPDALEDRVLAALAARGGPVEDARDHGQWIVGRAATIAHRAGRQASCTDLWASLAESQAATLVDDSKLGRGPVLFALFHGGREPDITLADERDVFVVLRNDHYTTQQFVCSILQEVFALPDAQATALMLATHTTGRAVIGRFTAAAARAKIGEVRTLAHAQAFPLWIGVEPA